MLYFPYVMLQLEKNTVGEMNTLFGGSFIYLCFLKGNSPFKKVMGVQPKDCGPHAAQDGYECGPKQNHKFT